MFFTFGCINLNGAEKRLPLQTHINNYIGINLGGIQDWAEDRAFADVFRSARGFSKIGSNEDRSATIDSKGWPTEDAWCYVWVNNNMHGTYKLSFTGKAETLSIWGPATIENKKYDAKKNTTSADIIVIESETSTIVLNFTGTSGGVKDIKCMRPLSPGSLESYPVTTEFTDQIKSIIAKFQCIRFLGWDATNWNISKTWSDRVPDDYFWGSNDPTGYGWEGRGASWESMIRLCNETNTDAYINIPISADDNYIRELALLWKKNLKPDLKLYVEYSNEIWNWSFSQSQQNVEDAQLEYAAEPYPLNFDNRDGGFEGYYPWRRIAKKTVLISEIFRSVWGNEHMMSTVRPVLMWQQPNGQGTAAEMLAWLNYYTEETGKPINYYIYGGGGSAYYNPDNTSDSLTSNNIWSSDTFNTETWRENNVTDASYVAAMGIKRIAYEGGPSLDNFGHSEDIKEQAVNDPQMQACVTNHHTMWSNYGGDLLVYLCSTGDYQWGFTQNIFLLNTPKLQAIDHINATNRTIITYGKTIPATIYANKVDVTGGNTYISADSASLRIGENKYSNGWVGYVLNVQTEGTYNISFQVDSENYYTGSVNIYCDGTLIGTKQIDKPGQITTPDSIYLQRGLHFIRFYNAGTTEVSLRQIIVNSKAGSK